MNLLNQKVPRELLELSAEAAVAAQELADAHLLGPEAPEASRGEASHGGAMRRRRLMPSRKREDGLIGLILWMVLIGVMAWESLKLFEGSE